MKQEPLLLLLLLLLQTANQLNAKTNNEKCTTALPFDYAFGLLQLRSKPELGAQLVGRARYDEVVSGLGYRSDDFTRRQPAAASTAKQQQYKLVLANSISCILANACS